MVSIAILETNDMDCDDKEVYDTERQSLHLATDCPVHLASESCTRVCLLKVITAGVKSRRRSLCLVVRALADDIRFDWPTRFRDVLLTLCDIRNCSVYTATMLCASEWLDALCV